MLSFNVRQDRNKRSLTVSVVVAVVMASRRPPILRAMGCEYRVDSGDKILPQEYGVLRMDEHSHS